MKSKNQQPHAVVDFRMEANRTVQNHNSPQYANSYVFSSSHASLLLNEGYDDRVLPGLGLG